MTAPGGGAGGGKRQRAAGPAVGPLTLIHTNNSPNLAAMRAYGVNCMSLQPWNEGYQAGKVGQADCPYQVGTTAAWSWSSGYVEGRADAKSTTGG